MSRLAPDPATPRAWSAPSQDEKGTLFGPASAGVNAGAREKVRLPPIQTPKGTRTPPLPATKTSLTRRVTIPLPDDRNPKR